MANNSQLNLDVHAPYDNALLEMIPTTDEATALAALETAFRLHRDRGGWLDAATRMGVLERFAALVEGRIEPLARQAAAEGGKPLKDSMVEVERGVNGVRVAIAEIAKFTGTEIPMGLNAASAGRFAHTFHEPRGVVLAISAFNHPFNLIIHQVITAIATGCPVLVKPAKTTPLSCRSVVEMLAEAGLPDGWCQLVITANEVTEKLVGDSRVAYLTFIGSARVGWHLRSKLAPGATCALEHGGAAPVIVDATADLSASIAPLVRGGFYHAGQVCVSVQRIYLERSIAADFSRAFVDAASKLVSGDPLDAATDVGPLISKREVDRVDSWVKEAIEGGAELLCGGGKLSDSVYAPTVLLNPPEDAHVSQEEIFGPVVCLYTYDDLDEAIERANAPDVYFQASIFTNDLQVALRASRELNGMAIMVNDHTAFRVDWMPFGGHRKSGMGVGGIGYTMREMSIERMVVFRSAGLE